MTHYDLREMSIAAGVISLIQSLSFIGYIYMLQQRQEKAYLGDSKAAYRLFLPCYNRLFYIMSAYCGVCGILIITLYATYLETLAERFTLLRLFSFLCTSASAIPTIILTRPSVSPASISNVLIFISPFIIGCVTLLITYAACLRYMAFSSIKACNITIYLSCNLIPLIFCFVYLTKLLPSRLSMMNSSNRCPLLIVAICMAETVEFGLSYAYFDERLNHDQDHDGDKKTLMFSDRPGQEVNAETEMFCLIAHIFIIPTFIAALYLPHAVYRTLLADTKYWRGIGMRNKGGIEDGQDPESLPHVQVSVLSDAMQRTMHRHGSLLVDFAFIKVGEPLGCGAGNRVYRGCMYGKQKIAIRVRNDSDITEDILQTFSEELTILKKLNHPHIVDFLGMTVRPPQLAILNELMNGGTLRDALDAKDAAASFTMDQRITCMLAACRAVHFMHSCNIMHRDLKAENMFRDGMWHCKIGDFGEACYILNSQGGKNVHPVVGTVAFMAPELIAGEDYSSEVDVYALGICMWELWHGKNPFDDLQTFDIYKSVEAGNRPLWDSEAPGFIVSAATNAWAQEASKRPTARSLAIMIEEGAKKFFRNNKSVPAVALEVPRLRATTAIAGIAKAGKKLMKLGSETSNPIQRTRNESSDENL